MSTIRVRKNGPYVIDDESVTVVDWNGQPYEIPAKRPVVMCRCGASQNKPFCDKSHARIGFAPDGPREP